MTETIKMAVADVVRVEYTGDQFAQNCPTTETIVETYTRDRHGADYYSMARRHAERANGFGSTRGALPRRHHIVRRG